MANATAMLTHSTVMGAQRDLGGLDACRTTPQHRAKHSSPGMRPVPTSAGTHIRESESNMSENTDKTKGRVKEAAGDLTGDEDLQREGKADQASGKIKGAIDDVKDKLTGK